MKIIIGVITGYCCLVGLIYFFQDALIFFPMTIDRTLAQVITTRFPRTEELLIPAADKTRLHGWLVRPEAGGKAPLVIYFGGNAEEVSWLIAEAPRFQGWAVCLVNYRGYGLSEGKPGEQALYRDALSIYDSMAGRGDIDAAGIVVMGRSIGSAVAAFLAQHRPVKAVILICPFDSLVSIGRKHYPFLPVELLLRNRFDSFSRAASIKAPMLALVAGHDTIIPRESSMRLADAWGGPHAVKTVAGDHNTLQEYPEYWESIRQFLARQLTKK
jgi:uncharacterized protein